MAERLQQKIALVFGAGSSGPGWGNGKAVAVEFAREGAKVIAVDLNLAAAEETRRVIEQEGGSCTALGLTSPTPKASRVPSLQPWSTTAASTFCIIMSASRKWVVQSS